MTRRDFIRLAAVFSGAALLEACVREGIRIDQDVVEQIINTPSKSIYLATPTNVSQFEPTIEPTSTPALSSTPTASPTASGTARVAFVKTQDRAQGIRQAIEMLEIDPVHGKQVFLKPNFNSSDPAPGSTHPDVLRTLVGELQRMGADRITVGDRSGMGNTRQVMDRLGVFELADELGFETLVFDELSADDWLMFRPEASHWQRGFPFARPLLESDAILQTCCLKTHRFGGHFTLSLKNSVGMVAKYNLQDDHNYMNELHNSSHQRRMIAEINAAYSPALVVLDGTEAFVNGGPDQGKMVNSEVILVGTDRIAIDAVGVALLRYYGTTRNVSNGAIFELEQIARAVELGIGVNAPEKIELVTGDPHSDDYAQLIKEILFAESSSG